MKRRMATACLDVCLLRRGGMVGGVQASARQKRHGGVSGWFEPSASGGFSTVPWWHGRGWLAQTFASAHQLRYGGVAGGAGYLFASSGGCR